MKLFVCSSPTCRASHAEDPKGHCPTCLQANGSGWSTVSTDLPRRIRIDLFTPAETAIRAAMMAVEEAGCDVLLTEAVNLLAQAQRKVADYVDRPRI